MKIIGDRIVPMYVALAALAAGLGVWPACAPLRAAPVAAQAPAGTPAISAAKSDALHARVRSQLKVFTDWLAANNAKGFIGEVGWPDTEAGSWNAVAQAWFQDADAARLWVTVWATGEWWGANYKLAAYEKRPPGLGVNAPNAQAAVIEAHPSTPDFLRGINVAGGEFGTGGANKFSNRNPGVYDQRYHYDSQHTFDYLAGRGIKLIRLPFRWERLQPDLGGELDAGELGRLQAAVARARKAGLQVILDLHNYGTYSLSQNGAVVSRGIGSLEVPIAHFADVWRRLSSTFKNDAGVFYGLMNEPKGLNDPSDGLTGARLWERISQAGLEAIRKNGDTKLVLVPGYNWSGAQVWQKTHPKGWIVDPAGNFRYEAHHYWDADNSGTYRQSYAETVDAAVKKGYTP